jgi:hypothetical protein
VAANRSQPVNATVWRRRNRNKKDIHVKALRIYILALISVSVVLLMSGCCTMKQNPPAGDNNAGDAATNVYRITIPIEPLPLNPTNGNLSVFTDTNYPNTEFILSLNQFDASGNVQYGVGSANIQGDTYEEVVDFKKYFVSPIPLDNADGSTDYAFLHVGMAYRAKIQFVLLNGSINAGFSGITASATASNITGNISFSLFGLDSSTAQSSIPMPSAITPDKIEEYFQSLAIVKNVVNAGGIPIRPQIIAINPNGHTINEVINAYYQKSLTIQTNSQGAFMGIKFQ